MSSNVIQPVTAVVDLDLYKYHGSAAGEKRTIRAVHKSLGIEVSAKSRTDFYGRKKTKDGGKLAELNVGRLSPLTHDEFEIIDVQEPIPESMAINNAINMVRLDLKEAGAVDFLAYLGRGDSFRVERSTLMKYKGNRADLLKPVHYDAVTAALERYFKAEWVEGIETDDKLVIEAYRRPDRFILGEDKDYWGCPVNYWNRLEKDRGIVNCNKFGKLWIVEKGEGTKKVKKVKGEGRLFMYFQILSGDSSDNYKANCMSDATWADMSAYKVLSETTNDKEALQVIVDSYKKLYPETKIVMGWREDEIEINWLYVLQEMWEMAQMVRFDGDKVNVKSLLDKMGVDY